MAQMNPETMLVATIDMQRGFMPEAEGVRLDAEGFGELPVTGGQEIVDVVNAINVWAREHQIDRATTQDWHPPTTAHFGEGDMQWPVHCVADTPGAELHPNLDTEGVRAYKKGQEAIASAEQDTSYTGFNAIDENGESLGDYAKRTRKLAVIVVGLALGGKEFDTCVDATARDFATKTDADVYVVRDATRAILPEQRSDIEAKLEAIGVQMIEAADLIEGRVINII